MVPCGVVGTILSGGSRRIEKVSGRLKKFGVQLRGRYIWREEEMGRGGEGDVGRYQKNHSRDVMCSG